MKDRTCYLVGKMLSNEATGDELNELSNIRLSDSQLSSLIEEISKWWSASVNEGDDEASKNAFQRHLQRLKDDNLFSNGDVHH